MSFTYCPDNEEVEDHVHFVVIDEFQEKFGAAVSFSPANDLVCMEFIVKPTPVFKSAALVWNGISSTLGDAHQEAACDRRRSRWLEDVRARTTVLAAGEKLRLSALSEVARLFSYSWLNLRAEIGFCTPLRTKTAD